MMEVENWREEERIATIIQQSTNVPTLSTLQKLFLISLLVVSFPLAFLGTWARTGSPIPECFLEFPPQDCLLPKAAFNSFIFFFVLMLGVALFAAILLFPYFFPPSESGDAWFHFYFVQRIYRGEKNEPATPGKIAKWGYVGIPLMLVSWFAMWAQPQFLGSLLHVTFVPLWVGFILTQDTIVYYRQGYSMISQNAAAIVHVTISSGVGWLYFEFMGYFTQNWYYPINKIWSPDGYIIWYMFCYMTIFPSLFEWADFLFTFKYFRTAWSNGPKVKIPIWVMAVLIVVSGIGCFMMAKSPYDTLWCAFSWLAPMFFTGFGLTLLNYPNPWTLLASGDFGPFIVYGLSGLFNGFCWEGWNYFSPPHNPSYWKYDLPFLNKFHIFEMPLVGFLGYIPFGLCCWTMWLGVLALINPPRPFTWKDAWKWFVGSLIIYFGMFFIMYLIKGTFA